MPRKILDSAPLNRLFVDSWDHEPKKNSHVGHVQYISRSKKQRQRGRGGAGERAGLGRGGRGRRGRGERGGRGEGGRVRIMSALPIVQVIEYVLT